MTPAGTFRRLASDVRGQTTLEWALLLVGFGLPMVYVFGLLLSGLVGCYRMITFFEGLPFP